ncbi:MAG: aminotransferase class IV, partial [Phycisphaerales bacterium]|nr:aminotransferase class IV [Phycisphaerales bacterium]
CLDPKIHHCNLLQSILAKIEANAGGADDALMLDTRGFVAETNATHVFIVVDAEPVHTPGAGAAVVTPRTVACPEGITRAAVLELCRCSGIAAVERDVSLAEVYRARECFCTGTMGEIAWVSRVDGRRIGDGRCGAMTRRLRGLFRDLTAAEGERVVG